MQKCIFTDNKICDNCSDCNICDLDENKMCDNCGKCLEFESEYKEIKVEGILDDEIDYDDYFYEEINGINETDAFIDEFENEELRRIFDDRVEELYIEDIPELREKYYKDLDKILSSNEDDEEE